MVVGTDIAELLLEGRPQAGNEYALSASTHHTETAEREADGAVDDQLVTTASRTVVSKPQSTMSTDELSERFRHLLLSGHKRVCL